MEHAIEKMRKLPDDRQESFARFLLTELDSDSAWEKTTISHSRNLDQLVKDVLEADARGETEILDPESL